ncbi:MAG: hypothetical protein EHM48_01420 [Planctomycetaceae bacterium]|nr:MAG: hypothetical protein EHM48_01420 [Planctomycetaceae bacterium]
MSKSSIFKKNRLDAKQLRTVAERRFGDANALRDTGLNPRANGAMYLGGFVVECLLKAKLLERFPWLENDHPPQGRSKEDSHLWSLCYRSHALDEILAKVPAVTEKLSQLEQREANRLTQSLKSICADWTIFARYSTHNANINDARAFLDKIKEIKKWLT